MSHLLEELIVILTIILCSRKLERMSVSKCAAQNFDMQEAKWCGKEKYQVIISNRLAALGNLDDDDDDDGGGGGGGGGGGDDVNINRAWESIRENTKNFSHRKSWLLWAETA